jgi:hypothetical protein
MSESGNNLGPGGSANTKDYDLRWKKTLQQYHDNYILYLTKKVRDNNTDSSLRQKVIDLNNELKEIIEEVKIENENLLETIKINQQQFDNKQSNCNKNKENGKKYEDKGVENSITLNKKLKNINEKQEITGNIINLLYVICGVLFIVNILIIYFIIKKK